MRRCTSQAAGASIEVTLDNWPADEPEHLDAAAGLGALTYYAIRVPPGDIDTDWQRTDLGGSALVVLP